MISEPTYPVGSRPLERGLTLSLGSYWHRIALFLIVALAAVLNFVGLNREGYDNQFYAAAVKSMSESWHNFFYNSFDPGGFVTIDKPPLGFWFQVASVKLFGFNGVSLLLPQALAGVLSVTLLYYLVSRNFGRVAGLIAALALAVTPISVVTNRNNTIDSTLVLFVLLSAWAVLRAAETGQLRWLLLSAALVGLGFNIKMLEAYLVVPALGLVYLLGTRKSLWRRLGNLFLALIVMVAISLSWATAVDLTAASQRPWVDSTTTNSEIDLAIGYNGLQRLTGNHSVSGTAQSSQPAGGAGASGTLSTRSTSSRGTSTVQGSTGGNGPGGGNGGPGGVGENGPTGVFRLLDTQLGSQIGWFLPLAILGFLIAFWQTRPRFRILDDRQRALVLWGAWLLTTGAFFSVALFYHTYYLVMVAPAISALAGIGIVSLWQEYRRRGSRMWWTLPLSLLIAGGIEARILSSYPSWSSWLTPLVVAACVLAAIALIVFRLRPLGTMRLAVAPAVVAVLALMAPATTFAAYTMQHTQTGAILRAGPTASGTANGQGGFGGPGGGFGGPGGGFGGPPSNGSSRPNNAPPTSPNGNGATGQAGPGAFGPPPGAITSQGTGSRAQFGSGFGQGGNGGPGGQTSSALIKYLVSHRGTAKYLVATPSSNEASPIIIATGDPVMSLGGFTGSDPILTTAKLASLTKQGVVRYFLLGGGGPAGSNSLTSWIQQHSKVISVGGTQLYEYTG